MEQMPPVQQQAIVVTIPDGFTYVMEDNMPLQIQARDPTDGTPMVSQVEGQDPTPTMVNAQWAPVMEREGNQEVNEQGHLV